MIRICFHGAESTGKSTLARAMAERFGCPWVPEYGRDYCETRGTNLTMADLLEIARGQNQAMHEAMRAAMQQVGAADPPLLLLDTDPLMTAAWAKMLFGKVPAELLAYPRAELYLAFAADVPWIEDGTRFFGSTETREQFAAIAEDMLARAGVKVIPVAGDWAARERIVSEVLEGQARIAPTM